MADAGDLQEQVAYMRLILSAWLRERREELQRQLQYGNAPPPPHAPLEDQDHSDVFGTL